MLEKRYENQNLRERGVKTYNNKICISFVENPIAKILQKFDYNNHSVAHKYRRHSHIFAFKKKNRIFHSEHLFTFCTRQPIARTTIAAIVRYRAIIRNIEWSKYKREVSAKG